MFYAVVISQQKHGARKHRGTVGNNACSGIFDGQRSLVIRIYTHASGADDNIRSLSDHIQNAGRYLFVIIIPGDMVNDLCVKLRQLVHNDRGEGIFDTSVEHFISGCHNTDLLTLKRL